MTLSPQNTTVRKGHPTEMTRTLDQIARLADTDVLDHLDRQIDVPLLSGVQPQGDIIVIPADGRRIYSGSGTGRALTVGIILPTGETWTEHWPTDPDRPIHEQFFDVTFPVIQPATTPVPRAGVPVVRGENGGNTHLLIGDGPVLWTPGPDGAQTLGALTVPDGSAAYLIHPEHGAAGIAAGTYLLRRQREQRDVVALVAD